jgi:hypothetical protein
MNNQEIIDNAPEGATHINAIGTTLFRDKEDGIRSLADIKRIVELEKDRDQERIKRLEEDALVMANARRLIKANIRTSNGRLYSEIFGTGFGSGRDGCRQLGLNPDCNKTSYENMRAHISSKSLKEPKP